MDNVLLAMTDFTNVKLSLCNLIILVTTQDLWPQKSLFGQLPLVWCSVCIAADAAPI